MSQIIVVMGVSGSGKSTVGRALADQLGCRFYDGDDYHAPENVAKMAAGIPLDDRDRQPWLEGLRRLIDDHLNTGDAAVLACSALKKAYRDLLRAESATSHQNESALLFVYLKGTFEAIESRMQERHHHYMKAEMLHSQFADLEEPDSAEAITMNAMAPLQTIIDQLI